MSTDVIVIDSSASGRVTLIHQLGTIGSFQSIQFSNIYDAKRISSRVDDLSGFIFLSLQEGLQEIEDFVREVRLNNQRVVIIALASSVTLDQMRALVQCGVDQILLRPFSASQLKDKIVVAEKFRQKVQEENRQTPSLAGFEQTIEELTEKFYRVNLSGQISENATLSEIYPAHRDATLFVNCDHLRGINSIGIRLWVLWFKALERNGFIRFEFENLRPALLQQVNFVENFIPENGAVNSFYLYYLCEDFEQEFKISFGKDFSTSQMKIPKIQEVIQDGAKVTFEIDPISRKFLKFYKGTIEFI